MSITINYNCQFSITFYPSLTLIQNSLIFASKVNPLEWSTYSSLSGSNLAYPGDIKKACWGLFILWH